MSLTLKVEMNQAGRDFIVGDVHGNLLQLEEQLENVGFNPLWDRVFCLGDLIDRGPYSQALLERIDQKTYFSVFGNHEAMMVSGFENPTTSAKHTANGGEWFYKLDSIIQKSLVSRARSLPWAIELNTGNQSVGLIHANVFANSWSGTLQALTAIEKDWISGASIKDNKNIESLAEQLLWDRTLARLLYRRVLNIGDSKHTIAEYKRLFFEHTNTLDSADNETFRDFTIDGIDALYLGHNFVPKKVSVGHCHFLDTFRGERGEELTIVCVNSPE